MTEAEQRERYGRLTAELDSLLIDSGANPLVIETEFLIAAAETSDVSQMIRLIHCAQYISEKGMKLCLQQMH